MDRHPPTLEHNYLRKLADLQAVGAFPAKTLGTADVTHDDWCDALTTDHGFCNCDPHITLHDGLLSRPNTRRDRSGPKD